MVRTNSVFLERGQVWMISREIVYLKPSQSLFTVSLHSENKKNWVYIEKSEIFLLKNGTGRDGTQNWWNALGRDGTRNRWDEFGTECKLGGTLWDWDPKSGLGQVPNRDYRSIPEPDGKWAYMKNAWRIFANFMQSRLGASGVEFWNCFIQSYPTRTEYFMSKRIYFFLI